jgi:hypothetical protein
MVNKRDIEVFIVCLSYHFDVGLFHVIGHGGTPLVVLDDTHILTMTRTCLGPKQSSMRFGYSYSRDTRFSTYDLSSICIIIVLALTLTIQDAYDGGNKSSKLVSTIIFEGL